mgnify:FL=1
MGPLLALALTLGCPTCASAAQPGLAAADLAGGYPLQYARSGPYLALEGDRVIRFDGRATPAPLELFVAGDLLAPASIAAGFNVRAADRLRLHVCGPEVTVRVLLP